MKGLEPLRLSAPDPKSGSATNYDTSAKEGAKLHKIVVCSMNISLFLTSCCLFSTPYLSSEFEVFSQVNFSDMFILGKLTGSTGF